MTASAMRAGWRSQIYGHVCRTHDNRAAGGSPRAEAASSMSKGAGISSFPAAEPGNRGRGVRKAPLSACPDLCHRDYERDAGPFVRNMKALVLSGGGGFGAYQVGAWRALSEANWQPDIVLGTSIGAVNAFLVSRGFSAEELRHAWLELPARFGSTNGASRLFPYSREIPRFRAWTTEIVRLFAARPLSCRLQVCMAELWSGAMRIVEDGAVGEQHLLAACALPPLMPPVRIAGRLYLDGGTLYPVPLKEAVATGADEVIAVDLFLGAPCNAPRGCV